MDPQKKFLASTLQGALDADVLTRDDLYRHMSAQVLAEHLPTHVLWECLLDGLKNTGLSTGELAPAEEISEDVDERMSEVPEAEFLEGDVRPSSIDIDVSDALEELPPLPDDEELEDVDWDETK